MTCKLENVCSISKSSQFIDIVDFQANSPTKDGVFIKYFDKDDQLKEITYDEYRYSLYSTSHYFREELVEVVKVKDPDDVYINVGYMSNSDKDCIINQLAVMYLNITPVVISPRNSTEIVVHLLKKSGAKALIHDLDCEDKARLCLKALPGLKLISKLVFSAELTKPISPPKKVMEDQGLEQIVTILHSSGTTSMPKLIPLSNRYIITSIERSRIDPRETFLMTSDLFSVAPMFHMWGISMIWRVLYRGTTLVVPSYTMSPKTILNQVRASQAKSIVSLPLQITQMVEYCLDELSKQGWNFLSEVIGITYSGAPLPNHIAKIITKKGIRLLAKYGSTEVGIAGTYLYDSETSNFKKLTICPYLKYTLTDRVGDRCQILVHKDDKGLASKICGPDEDGYLTGDLIKILRYDPDTKLLNFECVGRANDTIVHISGEKTNPIPIEDTIMESRFVEKCVVVGQGRLNNCLLIQLSKEVALHNSLNAAKREIYDKIIYANSSAPSHSRIDKDLVYFLPLNTDSTLPVTAKGGIIRYKVEVVFKDEIEKTYSEFGNRLESKDINQNTRKDIGSIIDFIDRLFHDITDYNLKSDISFFKQGMDSLSAVKFTNILRYTFPESDLKISVVYELDKRDRLARYIHDTSRGKIVKLRTLESHQEEVDSLIQKYSHYNFIEYNDSVQACKGTKLNVLVTGANGSLGSFVIKALLERDDIGSVYGLVRAQNNEDAIVKFNNGLIDRKINLSAAQRSQVKVFAYITDHPQLGLNHGDYKFVFNTVDVIYHVAWRMDFLKGVEQFKDCIEGTVSLLNISASSPKKPSFHFTSTIGAALPVCTTPEVQESKLSTALVNIGSCNGYNLSKLASETICYNWAKKFGFSLDIHRVGQVSGDTENGIWNVREHIPLLIKAAQVMRVIPEGFMKSVSWIPVDYASKAMVEINFATNKPNKSTVSHITNPHSTPWKDIATLLQELGVECKTVSNKKFMELLRSEPEFQNANVNPLASLSDFFSEILDKGETIAVHMETDLTSQRAPSVKACPLITDGLLDKYINYWGSIGFLDS